MKEVFSFTLGAAIGFFPGKSAAQHEESIIRYATMGCYAIYSLAFTAVALETQPRRMPQQQARNIIAASTGFFIGTIIGYLTSSGTESPIDNENCINVDANQNENDICIYPTPFSK
jgi:uncharacterized membrane protein YfcA